jgi:DNA-binding FadR family transcriptional regulator
MAEQTRYLDKIQSEHAAIYEAIRAQDVTKARASMRRHLTNGLKRLKGMDDTATTDAGMPE